MIIDEYTMRRGKLDTYKRIKEYFDSNNTGDDNMFGQDHVYGIPAASDEKIG